MKPIQIDNCPSPDFMSYQEIDEARKVKEFFDPNFTSPIGVFYRKFTDFKITKNGNGVLQRRLFSCDYSATTCLSKNLCHAELVEA